MLGPLQKRLPLKRLLKENLELQQKQEQYLTRVRKMLLARPLLQEPGPC